MHWILLLGPGDPSELRLSSSSDERELRQSYRGIGESQVIYSYRDLMPGSEHEVKVITARFDKPNSASIDTFLANDGYQAFLKAAKTSQEEIIEEIKKSGLR